MPHVPDTVPGKRVTDVGARTEGRGQPSNIRGGSRMQESCTYGSMRGAPSNGRPYRNRGKGPTLRVSVLFRSDFSVGGEPTRGDIERLVVSRGTDGSNPVPSTGESTRT